MCDIAIVDGSETDFVVTNAEASWVLRAMDDQDRRNWVLEIIKQRPIRSIIEMLRDDKVRRFSHFAREPFLTGDAAFPDWVVRRVRAGESMRRRRRAKGERRCWDESHRCGSFRAA